MGEGPSSRRRGIIDNLDLVLMGQRRRLLVWTQNRRSLGTVDLVLHLGFWSDAGPILRYCQVHNRLIEEVRCFAIDYQIVRHQSFLNK